MGAFFVGLGFLCLYDIGVLIERLPFEPAGLLGVMLGGSVALSALSLQVFTFGKTIDILLRAMWILMLGYAAAFLFGADFLNQLSDVNFLIIAAVFLISGSTLVIFGKDIPY